MLKPEVQTPESDPEDNYDMSSSDDDDIEDSANYINASLLSVRALAYFFTLICIKPYTESSRCETGLNLSSWAVAAV